MQGYDSVLDTIGDTPLVEIETASTADVPVLAKLEGFDPSGSIKGRVARRMIDQAEADGVLDDQTILEPTSGNTGIALAMVANHRGYDATLVMPASMSVERIQVMKAFGADIILTPPDVGEDGAIEHARELAEEDGYWMPDQFSNRANVEAHYKGTGPELWDQTDGDITHFVAAWGTSGTLMGVGRFLREQEPSVQVIGVEPESCDIQGLKSFEDGLTPEIYDESIVDRVEEVSVDDACRWTQRLASEESLFMGQSSGANACIAHRIAERLDDGVIVTTFADFGFKYLSAEPYCRDGLLDEVQQAREADGPTRVSTQHS